jgi:hypothetical protein
MQVSDFQTIRYDSSQQVLFVLVNEQTEFATAELVKEAQYVVIEALEAHKPPNLLINVVDLRFPITPELQEWINQEIVPRFFGLNVKKVAYVMPTEFIEKLSMEQMYDEISHTLSQEVPETNINYFKSEADALRWFSQKRNNLHRFA